MEKRLSGVAELGYTILSGKSRINDRNKVFWRYDMIYFAKKTVFTTLVLLCVLASQYVVADIAPVAVVADGPGERIFVAEFEAKKVAVIGIVSGKVEREIRLSINPTGIAVSADGKKLYVTGGGVKGCVETIDIASGKSSGSTSVGHSPTSPVLSADGNKLYVCNRFTDDVSVIDLAGSKEVKRIKAVRQPSASAITPDGKLLFVANLLSAGVADGAYTAAAVTVIDTGKDEAVATVQLPNGSMGVNGVCVSPDGRYAYVTHILGRYQLPTTQLERGWMNTNALSVIDVATQKLVNTVLIDDLDLGAANPWSVACSGDGKFVCVAIAGTHEICVIDRTQLHDRLDKIARGEKVTGASTSVDEVPNDLSFLVGCKKRFKLSGKGPRSIAVVGDKVYAGQYFSDTIEAIAYTGDRNVNSTTIELGSKAEMTEARRGEMLFNDATICFQQWQSCASCHPGQGRVDGINWDLLNDGLGNPKNTKSLLYSHVTPPAMGLAVRDNAETAVRAGIRHILFAVRDEADAEAIDTYLKLLEAVESPTLVKGRLSRNARKGKKLFKQANCAECHSGEYYTDLEKYNVSTGRDREADVQFDTPGLREVWRTGPYLHDGRAATIEEVVTKYNKDDRHGITSGLSEEEISSLVEYVLSL